MNVPVIFARKRKSLTLIDDLLTASVHSFTKNETNEISISKKYLNANDRCADYRRLSCKWASCTCFS